MQDGTVPPAGAVAHGVAVALGGAGVPPVTPCEYARERHHNLLLWRNLWSILIFMLGSAIVISLAVAVLFLLRQSWLTAAIGSLGTVVSSLGTKWVVDRRNDAVHEEETAYQDVVARCAQNEAQAVNSVRTDLKLFKSFL
jgi:hypothetical protein